MNLHLTRAGKALQLVGIAVRLGTAIDTAYGREILAPGAFRNGVVGSVAALWSERVLGRVRASTMRVSEINGQLRYSIDLPATQFAADLVNLVETGAVRGVDIGMAVLEDAWSTENGVRIRTVKRAQLRALVVTPFERPGSTVAVQAVDASRSAHWRTDLRRRRLELERQSR
ncbi:MAG TPA: HK97 family phage prohead protease [Gammaproteobacteria bacterium]|nr:HK97 family phage prohead protease [Gammaproteobacteria bacterium]